MKTGTKSLLFGVHQFIWHPITVWLAWTWLYRKLPNWKECICIIIHDWGYWGKEKMDDKIGETHPEWAANFALRNLDSKIKTGVFYCHLPDEIARYSNLCLYHSRHYSKRSGVKPSKLCWADKLSMKFDPWWLYLPRAWASGELFEYRAIGANSGSLPASKTHREWFAWISKRLAVLGIEKRGDAIPYQNESNQDRCKRIEKNYPQLKIKK